MPIVLMSTYKSVPNLPIWPISRPRGSEGQTKGLSAINFSGESFARTGVVDPGRD